MSEQVRTESRAEREGDERSALDVLDGLWGKKAGLERPYPLVKHLLDTVAWAGVVWDR